MKTTVFQIKKGSTLKSKAYTHTIWFKGQMLSNEGYLSKYHYLMYDEYEIFDTSEFLALKVSDIPDHFKLRFDLSDETLYKEFEFSWVRKQDGKLLICAWSYSNAFKSSLFKPSAFFKTIISMAGKYHFTASYFNEPYAEVDLIRTYDANPDDQLSVWYDQFLNDFAPLYEATCKAQMDGR